MVINALHILVGLIGLVLLYIALFLTETEEGRIQNRLEEAWIRIDDLSKIALTKEAAFLQQVSTMFARGLDRLFGTRLLSAKAIATSFALSGAATLLSIHSEKLLPFQTLALIAGVILLVIAFTPGKLRYLGFGWIPLSVLWLFLGVGVLTAGVLTLPQYFVMLAGFYAGALLSDIFFVAISRWLLRKMSLQSGVWKLLLLVCSMVALATVLATPGLPLLLFIEFRGIEKAHIGQMGIIFLFASHYVGASNSISVLIVVLLLLLFLIALIHRLAWPLMARPLYATQRFKLFRSPKLLAGVAGSCFMFAWPQSHLVRFLTELLHLHS